MFRADLSRFSACTIRRIKLVDLMRLKEFRVALDAYAGNVTDQWVLETAVRIEQQLLTHEKEAAYIISKYGEDALFRRRKKHDLCHRIVKDIRKELAQYEQSGEE